MGQKCKQHKQEVVGTVMAERMLFVRVPKKILIQRARTNNMRSGTLDAAGIRNRRLQALFKYWKGIQKQRKIPDWKMEEMMHEFLIKHYTLGDTARRDYILTIKTLFY